MPDIKLKETVKGTIKTLDRAANLGGRIKQAYVRTKDKAEHSIAPQESSANEYVADRITDTTEAVSREAVHQFDKQGRKAVRATRGNIAMAKERMAEKKANLPKQQAQEQVQRQMQTAEAMRTTPASMAPSRPSVKASSHVPQAIKAVNRGTGATKQSAKSAGSASIKGTGRTIKTAQSTSRTAIKTAQATAHTAQKSAHAAAKATYRGLEAANAGARATGVKSAAKATAAAAKAIAAGTRAMVAAIAAGGWAAVLVVLIVVLFGCAASLFGGSSNSYTPVSAEVEAYDPLIRLYARQYGLSEYVELIKAVMMQESGGRGSDPMQASESGYNTQYPHTPGAISDPEYSIQVGIQTLADSLQAAQVDGPIDLERIRLALQGYNFGNGYISWAVNNYGGYSYANAVEFSTMQAQRLGWSSYGDTQYPSHVLRYYPYGQILTFSGNEAIVEVALTQVGNEGGEPYWSWYGFGSRVEWCACFVSWCANECGYIDAGLFPKFAGCDSGVQWFQERNQWLDGSAEPQPGMIIFFDWDNKGSSGSQDGLSDHVGIVEKVEDGIIYTIEGNSGDCCRENRYTVGHYEILGYGVLCL